MDPELAPAPESIWEPSTVMEDQIQILATLWLLKLEAEVGWRPVAGEMTNEIVVFLAHIKRGFGVPTSDFFRGLLYFYRIDLVHLVPNAITIVASFIHLCEAYIGVSPHFHLWRYFIELKKTGKSDVVS
jgi:hypothetical protein